MCGDAGGGGVGDEEGAWEVGELWELREGLGKVLESKSAFRKLRIWERICISLAKIEQYCCLVKLC